MSKYIIDVGDAYTKHICGKGDMLCLPVRINEFEDNWLNTNIPLTPYTEPDFQQVREEAYAQGYSKGFTNAKVQCNIQAEKDMREVGERHYQKGYEDATVKISSDEQAIAEKAYQKGLNDAWSFAEHLAYISDDVTNSVYMSMNGGKGLLVAFGMSYEDAKKQYDEYFKKKKEEQESITAEDVMRQYLDTFCKGRSCIGCPLRTPDFTCGRGKHFLHDCITDEEVRRAYAAVLAKMKEEQP